MGSLSAKQDIQISNNFSITVWINIEKEQLKKDIKIAKIGNEPDNIVLSMQSGFVNANVFKGSNGNSNFTTLQTEDIIEEIKWYHIAFVVENSIGYIYVNGDLKKNGAINTPKTMPRVNNYFGEIKNIKSNNDQKNVLLMDDLKIFSGSLQPEEVYSDYTKAQLINHWPMSNLSDIIGGADLFNGTNYEFTNDRFSNPGSSILFNNGYLTIPPNVYFNGDFSITLWVKFKSFQKNAKIFNFGNFGDAGESDNIQLIS